MPALRVLPPAPAGTRATTLPQRLSGPEFWTLSAELSEPDGCFRSDNLVSNEMFMQRVIPDLMRTVTPGRACIGVGPEQNFTYLAAIKPSMSFIVDIRRANLRLHSEEFCASAATLPLDDTSTFIRSERGSFGPRATRGPMGGGFAGNFSSQLHSMLGDVKSCVAGR